ncbi:scavenger receptor class B member 1-like [Tropilaelaps mercedesae]|uniref:Scavenger receptor class B member 1 n=1 Tax=Tropilaelaps mercedesae TaxID=418985 RepID=A0A1V9XHA3_9ACAR|nr:scavenger receptor class B member 1-like [Tropilaelaps mercedesae]
MYALRRAAKDAIIKPDSQAAGDFTAERVFELRCYLFNLTNEGSIGSVETPPELVQRGPYVFRVVRKRLAVFEDSGLMRYSDTETFYFDPSKSKGTLRDEILTPDPLVALLTYEKATSNSVKLSGLKRLRKRKTFTVRTVGQLLFDGYNDDFLTKRDSSTSALKLPEKLGYFYGRNGSTSKWFTIETGANDSSEVGTIRLINGKKQLPFYRAPCNVIEGTNGMHGPPFSPWDPPYFVKIFIQTLCRPWRLQLAHKRLNFYGLTVAQFHADREIFGWTGNQKYDSCLQPNPTGFWGTFDATPCSHNLPIVLSLPHFLHGTEMLGKLIRGLSPDDNLHRLYLNIYPILLGGFLQATGVTVDAAIRVQLNLPLNLIKYEKSHVIYPVLWHETLIPETTKEQIVALLSFEVQPFLDVYPLAALIVGLCYFMVGGLVWYIWKRVQQTNATSIDKTVMGLDGETLDSPNAGREKYFVQCKTVAQPGKGLEESQTRDLTDSIATTTRTFVKSGSKRPGPVTHKGAIARVTPVAKKPVPTPEKRTNIPMPSPQQRSPQKLSPQKLSPQKLSPQKPSPQKPSPQQSSRQQSSRQQSSRQQSTRQQSSRQQSSSQQSSRQQSSPQQHRSQLARLLQLLQQSKPWISRGNTRSEDRTTHDEHFEEGWGSYDDYTPPIDQRNRSRRVEDESLIDHDSILTPSDIEDSFERPKSH